MADTTNTAEIQVVVDASGVEAGLRQATGAAERAERQITGGANNSARSQGNLIAAIQRTTAQMESGGRAGSRYFEILAQQRGVNPAALEPYLRQLRAVEQAQQRAGQSAGQTRAAFQQLPAQMTDVIVSLQGGQNMLTVLLQQGGQVRDSFGSIGGAVRAVGGQLLGLLNPVTLATAAVAGLGYAYYAGSREARAYNLAIATTGNAAGTSAALMAEAAAQTSEFIGSQSNAAKVLASMVATGQISGAAMVDLSVAAIKAQRDLGREVSTTVDEFAALGKDPVKALGDLIGKYHHLSGATYAQVKALQDEGRTVEAVTVAQKAHADGINSQSGRVVENLGYIESAWRGVSKGVSEAAGSVKDWLLNLGRDDTMADLTASAAKIQKNIDLANARKDAYGARQQQALLDVINGQIAAMQKKLGLSQQEAQAEARRARADQLRIEIASGLDTLLSREQLRTRDLAAARTKAAEAGLSQVETEKLLAVVRQKYKDVDEAAQKKREAAAKAAAEALKKEAGLLAELAGLTPGFAEDWDRLSKAYGKGALSLDQLTKAQADLLAKQPGIKKAIDEQIKAQAESDKLYEQGIRTAEQYRDSLLEQLGAQRQNNEVIGLSAEAAADLQAQRLQDAAALKEETAAALEFKEPGNRVAELYRAQAAALRDLASAKQEGARKQVAADSAKQAAEDWKRASEQINQSLTDALLRGFESGKSFGRNLVDTLKNMFSTLVLRPVIQAAVQPMANQITGYMQGGSGSAAGASQMVGGLSSLFGGSGAGAGATSAGGASSMLGGAAGYAGWIAMGMAVADGLYKKGWDPNNGTIQKKDMLHPLVGESLLFNKIFRGIGISDRWASVLSGASLVTRLFGRKNPEIESQGFQGTVSASGFSGESYANILEKGGLFRSDKRYTKTAALGAEQDAGFDATIKAMIDATRGFASILGIEADAIDGYSKQIKLQLSEDEAKNQEAIAKLFGEVGDELSLRLVPSLTEFKLAGETASVTLQRLAGDYATIEQALWSIGMSFGAVGTASLEARERLLAAAGGLEAFAANTAGFQQNFLSEAERNAPVLKMVTEQMAAMGLSAIDTREEFKQTVLGLDLTTEAGAKQYGALMNLQAAFAQVYPLIDETAIAAEKAATALQQRNALQDEYDSLTMTSAQLLAKQRDALDESNRALFDQIQGIKAQAVTIQAAKDRASTLLSGVDSMFSALQSVVGREKSLLEQSANAHRALSSALRSTLDSMSASGQAIEDRQSARAQIQAALAIAKAGGVLPDADSLKGALSVLSKDASSMFATQQDYLRDFYSTQNDIAALAGLTDDALSVEEKSLKALDGILDSAQQQVNALKGVDYSVFSLAEAIRGWEGALGAAKADPVASAGGSIAGLYKELLGRPADSAGLDYWQNAVAGGLSLDQVRKMIMEGAEYKGLRGFAVGTNYVPTNMPAMIHEGERIIPAADNRELMRRLSSPSDNSAALVAELRAVRRELADLRKDNSDENFSMAKHLVQISDRVEALEKWDMTGLPKERQA